MFFNKFDSYYYSRPVAYKSYYPRIQKPQVLKSNDIETTEIINLLRRNGIQFQDMGGLSRGIRFYDIQVGKRSFNHHATQPEYYIRQWKETNDLNSYHPTGRHTVVLNFNKLLSEVDRITQERKKINK